MSEPPPLGWHPKFEEGTPPPRTLPELDHNSIDLAERQAARVTYAFGLAALAILILLACWRIL